MLDTCLVRNVEEECGWVQTVEMTGYLQVQQHLLYHKVGEGGGVASKRLLVEDDHLLLQWVGYQ